MEGRSATVAMAETVAMAGYAEVAWGEAAKGWVETTAVVADIAAGLLEVLAGTRVAEDLGQVEDLGEAAMEAAAEAWAFRRDLRAETKAVAGTKAAAKMVAEVVKAAAVEVVMEGWKEVVGWEAAATEAVAKGLGEREAAGSGRVAKAVAEAEEVGLGEEVKALVAMVARMAAVEDAVVHHLAGRVERKEAGETAKAVAAVEVVAETAAGVRVKAGGVAEEDAAKAEAWTGVVDKREGGRGAEATETEVREEMMAEEGASVGRSGG